MKVPGLIFGPFRLDPGGERLWRGDEALPLRHKAFATLHFLARQHGHLVTKDELLDEIWADAAVGDAVLPATIRELRRALGDDARAPQFIETVHGRGYRFVHPVTRATTSGPLVGRDEPMLQLERSFEGANRGERQLVLVTGEAGIGKTALVDAFTSRFEDEGTWVARGQCVEHFGTGEAYLPLLEALGRFGREPRGAELSAILRRHAPSWLPHLPALVAPENSPPSEATSVRMVRELAEALEVLTERRTLVLVLEDLHWSDESTLDWLGYLAHRRDPARLMVIATLRPVDGDRLAARIVELLRAGASSIGLDRLKEREVDLYLGRRFGEAHWLRDVGSALYQRTQGHPLFLVATIDELVQRGSFHERIDVSAMPIPTSVRLFLEQQLDRLSDEERAVLESASVAGNTFSVAALNQAVRVPIESIEERCVQWARRGLFLDTAGVESFSNGTIWARFSFRHALYREVLYARIPESRRARLHRAIALRLEPSAPAAELAVHFERGGDVVKAATHSVRAAKTAVARSAYAEAREHVDRGLAAVPRVFEADSRARLELELQILLGKVLMATRGWGSDAVVGAYARARTLSEELDDDRFRCLATYGLIAASAVRVEHVRCRELSLELLALARARHDPVFELVAEFELGVAAFLVADLPRSCEHLERAVHRYRIEEHAAYVANVGADFGVFARAFASHALWLHGNEAGALESSHRALSLANELGHPFTRVMALAYAAKLHQFRRDVDRTRELADQTLAQCAEHGFPYYREWARILRGWASVMQEENAEGVDAIEEGIHAIEDQGARRSLPYYNALLSDACRHLGRVDEARRALTRGLRMQEQTGERWWKAELTRLERELAD